jgi:hypothetical protein
MNRTPPATLFAIATAVAAIGSLTHVPPAQAYPSVPLMPPNACAATGYQFSEGLIYFAYPAVGAYTKVNLTKPYTTRLLVFRALSSAMSSGTVSMSR